MLSRRAASLLLLTVTLVAVGSLTLVPRPSQAGASALSPWYCLVCGSLGVVDVLLNTAFFVPVGAALAALGLRRLPVALVAAALSTSIELAQRTIVTGRDPALSDVLTNTTGALLGAALVAAGPLLWRPSTIAARRLAVGAAVAWLAMLTFTAWLLQPTAPPSGAQVLLAPRLPLVDHFQGTLHEARLDGVPLPRGPLDPARLAGARGGVELSARVTTARITDRRAPIVDIAEQTAEPWARLAQLGQKGTFSVQLNATRARFRTPDVRVYRGLPLSGFTDAILTGAREGPVLRASVTHGDTTLRAERRLTPGFGWALLLPIDYPLDQADHWTSAVWVALPLLLAGFWLGRGRVGVPVLVALGVLPYAKEV